ncbi:MAG: Spy/CpxP family protein refolding chaperone [Synechococcaceae cyanobacterium RL_1_2]|nr:Spy/CpxP family protein refolding chaperone [Synechococcaceae cyanobacterium RL_1_2]
MKLQHISLIAGVTALSLGSLVAFAEPHTPLHHANTNNNFEPVFMADRGEGEGGLRFGEGRLIEELELTPTQQAQIETLKENHRTEMEGLREQMQPIKDEIRELMVGTADKATIRAKHQEAQSLHTKIQDARFEQMLEIREVLTPEQRQKFASIMDQKRDKMPNRREAGERRMGEGLMRPRLQTR